MRLWQQATLAAALATATPVALAQDTTQPIHIASPTTVPARKSPTTDYAALFAHFDENLNNGQGLSMVDNTTGKLAWLESYQLLAYMHAWRATSRPATFTHAISRRMATPMESTRRGVRTSRIASSWSGTVSNCRPAAP